MRTVPSPSAVDHAHHQHHDPAIGEPSRRRLALSATLHCLIGCGTGEVVGMVLATALGLSNAASIGLTVTLGFVFGLALGLVPLVRARMPWGEAVRMVLVAEGLSIAAMEATDVLVLTQLPGVMDAHLTHPRLWIGMALGLAAGFVVAYPVNLWLLGRGVRHVH
ncbi:MAG TPA: DUF4396 domain-containing protein [Rhodothermales bacterium]|nr:DUF4396 domain-containing protein [Rhodothermales bacterium]